jgi:hypothetical protein
MGPLLFAAVTRQSIHVNREGHHNPNGIWVDPGTVTRTFMAFAMPAFLLSAVIVGGLRRLGINQIWSFMISMPLLIFGWFYFVGSLIDRRRWKRE